MGAYMVLHLLTNASILNGVGTFQSNVNAIHSLGSVLPLVEWVFIFLPILFHAVVGVWIYTTGIPNSTQYKFAANRRYTWQRWTGIIAFVFIFFHVLHLHGWFHFEWWKHNVLEPLNMGRFRPYSAGSTLALALRGVVWPVFYAVGVVACVYHLANGVWTAGITWGVWLTPKSQSRASWVCAAFGVGLAIVGLSALYGAKQVDIDQARKTETEMYRVRVETGEMRENPEKRWEEGPPKASLPAMELSKGNP